MKELVPWLWILAIAIVFWLLMIRPAQRRQAASARLQKSVAVGDRVVLTSGIFGTIVEEADDHVGVEVAEGMVIEVLRGAIGSKVHESDDEPEASDAESDRTDDEYAEHGETADTTTDDRDVVDGED